MADRGAHLPIELENLHGRFDLALEIGSTGLGAEMVAALPDVA
jgi:hypothetical protein